MQLSEIPLVRLGDGSQLQQLGVGTYKLDADTAYTIVRTALDLGYRHIDTAALYNNEDAVGRAVADSGIDRGEIWITTKLWHDFHLDATTALQTSLAKLRTDYVDLYLVHWPVPKLGTAWAAWRSLVELQTAGLAKSIGVSNFEIEHLQRIIADTGVVPAVNQIELHPEHQQRQLVSFCREHAIAVQAWSPLARGRQSLLGAPPVVAAAERYGKTPAQIILRWHLQQNFIVFPKTAIPARLRENAAIFDFVLTDEQMQALNLLERAARSGSAPRDFNG